MTGSILVLTWLQILKKPRECYIYTQKNMEQYRKQIMWTHMLIVIVGLSTIPSSSSCLGKYKHSKDKLPCKWMGLLSSLSSIYLLLCTWKPQQSSILIQCAKIFWTWNCNKMQEHTMPTGIQTIITLNWMMPGNQRHCLQSVKVFSYEDFMYALLGKETCRIAPTACHRWANLWPQITDLRHKGDLFQLEREWSYVEE